MKIHNLNNKSLFDQIKSLKSSQNVSTFRKIALLITFIYFLFKISIYTHEYLHFVRNEQEHLDYRKALNVDIVSLERIKNYIMKGIGESVTLMLFGTLLLYYLPRILQWVPNSNMFGQTKYTRFFEYVIVILRLVYWIYKSLKIINGKFECMIVSVIIIVIMFIVHGKRKCMTEWLFYVPFMIRIISYIKLCFTPIPIEWRNKLVDNKDLVISSDFLAKVNKICESHGYSSDSIVVDEQAFAASVKNFRYSLIIISTSLMKYLSENQVLAVLCHELGHLVNNDSLHKIGCSLLIIALIWIFSILAYRICNEKNRKLEFTVYIIVINAMFRLILKYIHTFLDSLKESRADRFATKEGYGNDLIEGFKKFAKMASAARSVGIELDCSKMFIYFIDVHPSLKDRIEAIQKLIKS